MISISDYYVKKCVDFAERQIDGSKYLYMKRGERNISKIKYDIVVGKMGEVAAYLYLKSIGVKSSKPDFSIYNSRGKSFSSDLVTECGKLIHVKSQSRESFMRYGGSWLMQKSDPVVSNPTAADFFIFISFNGNDANVWGFSSAVELVDLGLFLDPVVKSYSETKKALYIDSIDEAGALRSLL